MVEKLPEYGTFEKYQQIRRVSSGAQAYTFLVKRLRDGLELVAKINKDEDTFEMAK